MQTVEFSTAENVSSQNQRSPQNLSVYTITEDYESDSSVRSLTVSFLSSKIIWLLLLPLHTYTGVCTVLYERYTRQDKEQGKSVP